MGKYSSPKTPQANADSRAQQARDAVDKLLEARNLDEQNPMEQALKLDAVKKNMPQPGFMQVDVKKVEEPGELPYVESVAVDDNELAVNETVIHDTIESLDLNTQVEADVAACPNSVMPMLIDEYVQLAMEEKKAYTPDKRKRDEFNWWWLVFFMLPVPSILLIIFMFL